MGKRSIGLFRRGRYYYWKYKSQEGTWKERATRCVNYHEALAQREVFLEELRKNTIPNNRSKWTLQQAASAWLTDRGLRVARSTFLSEQTIVRNLLRVLGTGTKLVKLADIQCVKSYESARLSQKIHPKTVNNELQVLCGILREANLWHRVGARYKPLKVPRSDVGAALTEMEARKLVHFAKSSDPSAVAPFAAVLAYATGLRSKELKQLQLKSIQLEGSRPHIYVRRSTTKSDRGARYVALDRIAMWAMRVLLDRAGRLGSTIPEHFLLPTLSEKHTLKTDRLHGGSGYDPMNPQSSWDAEWGKLRKTLGFEHLRFHDLRHTYITRAAEAGVPLAVTQAQVGHMSAQMIDHYTHVCQAAIHQAAQRIEDASSNVLSILNIPVNDERPDQLQPIE